VLQITYVQVQININTTVRNTTKPLKFVNVFRIRRTVEADFYDRIIDTTGAQYLLN